MPSDKIDDFLNEMDNWMIDVRRKYIEMNMSEIERMAEKYEVTCDYYIAEFM